MTVKELIDRLEEIRQTVGEKAPVVPVQTDSQQVLRIRYNDRHEVVYIGDPPQPEGSRTNRTSSGES